MNEDQKNLISIPGLNEVLDGGLITKQSYLIQGGPAKGKSTVISLGGVRKTNLCVQFLKKAASYLPDNIIFLLYLEINEELQKAIGVLKKKLSDFGKSIRRFHITGIGIQAGEKLFGFGEVLSGIPQAN
ncbi:MAG: hypothetical protein MK198_13550 [Gracilimonas sp.]|uniref:hypothetical protein n=1 Tax=Gracilimonas sp. TaxID=1974203 RepID=UPI003750BD05|nr:hypothetical protein [Gracilimonas sp.]